MSVFLQRFPSELRLSIISFDSAIKERMLNHEKYIANTFVKE